MYAYPQKRWQYVFEYTWSTATHKGGYDRLNHQKNKTIEEGHRTDIRDRLNKSGENWLKEKQKLFIPYRVAIELQERGYIVREDIIWVKKLSLYPSRESIGTCMPFPVIDKFLPAHEVILHIVKSKKVKSFIDRIRCKLKDSTFKRAKYPYYRKLDEAGKVIMGKNWGVVVENELEGANPASCIMLKRENQHAEGHFAKFPITLPKLFIEGFTNIGDTVLDPFLGTGTTMRACMELNRNCIGIELNPKYISFIKKQLNWGMCFDVEFEFDCFEEREHNPCE